MAEDERSNRRGLLIGRTRSQDTAPDVTALPTKAQFAALIERSSLGVPGAAALRGGASHRTAVDTSDEPDAAPVPSQDDGSYAASSAPAWQGQLLLWLGDASQAESATPSSMVLEIADGHGRRSARTVLPEVLDEDGILFFTSDKARGLAETESIFGIFRWHQPARQVTLQGRLEKLGSGDAVQKWVRLPRGSQLDAWAPLIARQQFADVDMIPVPDDWCAWRVRPEVVEFCEPHAGGLYDTLRFTLFEGVWRAGRMSSMTNRLDHRAVNRQTAGLAF